MKILVLISILLCANNISAQVDAIRNYYKINLQEQIADTKWKVDSISTSEIGISLVDTMRIYDHNNAYRGGKWLDTLYVSFRFENNWTIEKRDSLESFNLAILDEILPLYVNFYDSSGWGKARVKKWQLYQEPKFAVLQDWYKSEYLDENNRVKLFDLVRLPDTLIGEIAVFSEHNFTPNFAIEPESIEVELDQLVLKIEEILLPKRTIRRNEGFYLMKEYKRGT